MGPFFFRDASRAISTALRTPMQKPAFLANLTRAIGLQSLVEIERKDDFSYRFERDAGKPFGMVTAPGRKHLGIFDFPIKDYRK
jgi:hypothetical protein